MNKPAKLSYPNRPPYNQHVEYEHDESIIPKPSLIPGMKGSEGFKRTLLLLLIVFLPILIPLAIATYCIRKAGRRIRKIFAEGKDE